MPRTVIRFEGRDPEMISSVRPYNAIILDIEGTICTISFVRDVLFPYAASHVEAYLRSHKDKSGVKELITELRAASDAENAAGDSAVLTVPNDFSAALPALVKNIQHWITADKKIGPMKMLQGLIWKEGYEKGHFQSELFPDVLPTMKQLTVPVYTYSSGSIEAQELFLKYCKQGDVDMLVACKFSLQDIGPKKEGNSYEKLAAAIGKPANDILFVTDIEEEAQAARTGGMRAMLMIRPGNAELSERAKCEFDCIRNLCGVLTQEDIDRIRAMRVCDETDMLKRCLESCRRTN